MAFGGLAVADVDTSSSGCWKRYGPRNPKPPAGCAVDWARVRGFRQGENPARWRGHPDKLLPKRGKVRAVKHHAAMPYAEVPAFIADLREREGISARALEFAILTVARTGEVIGAIWDEVDSRNKVWTVPADRMKAGKEHRVPLADVAIGLLEKLPRLNSNAHLFPGRDTKPLSNMAMLELLRGM